MKIFLITGGDSTLAKYFKLLYPEKSILLSKKQCNVTLKNSINQAFKKYNFTHVINTAAITDVELCEKKPLKCFSVNAYGVNLLNEACIKYKKKLIHISSDYAVNPVNIYGWSKYFSEKIMSNRFLVIRTNFYSKKTYLVKILINKPVSAYQNVYFNPLSINELVKQIYKLSDCRGIKNIFSNKKISNYQFAKYLYKVFRLKNQKLIKKAQFKNNKNNAFRPLTSFIKSDIKIDILDDINEFKAYNKI